MRDSTYKIDLNVVTFDAFCALNALDKTFVGTPNYMGVAFFWGHGVKHYLREASQAERRKIHKKWLAEGLDLHGESYRHHEIIRQVMPSWRERSRKFLKTLVGQFLLTAFRLEPEQIETARLALNACPEKIQTLTLSSTKCLRQ
jgi:hypothetical protein